MKKFELNDKVEVKTDLFDEWIVGHIVEIQYGYDGPNLKEIIMVALDGWSGIFEVTSEDIRHFKYGGIVSTSTMNSIPKVGEYIRCLAFSPKYNFIPSELIGHIFKVEAYDIVMDKLLLTSKTTKAIEVYCSSLNDIIFEFVTEEICKYNWSEICDDYDTKYGLD